MRMIRTTNSKENLCDSCFDLNGFPHCVPSDVEFGDGTGNDNIIACKNAMCHNSKTIYAAELVEKDIGDEFHGRCEPIQEEPA